MYRINFGDLSLDTPNESKDAGVTMGLYKWNGGGHQKVVMEKQAGYEGTVVRMKMQHSNMYLRATTDGERVVQSWADDWEWNQVWRLLPKETETEVSSYRSRLNDYGTSIHKVGNYLHVELSSVFDNGAVVRILDLQGREVLRRLVRHSAVLEVQQLPSGLYHVVASDGRRTDIRRFRK